MNQARNSRVLHGWGNFFAGAMIGFFIMVCLGLAAIYYYQTTSPQPEPVPFMDPNTIQK